MKVELFRDERGILIPIEFRDLSFNPVRCFVVSNEVTKVLRGGHKTGCHELILLLSGTASFNITDSQGNKKVINLINIGSSLQLMPSDYVEYSLNNEGSTILIFADRSYEDSLIERAL
jgi:hypothetical protein